MKRIINGVGNVNQLAPFKYQWAWKYFLNAQKNHWSPLDVNMAGDVADFKLRLTDNERSVYTNVMAYLATSDVLAMRNIGLAIMEKMTAPEIEAYQAVQINEEAIHSWTYQHCIETLGLDQDDVYNRYHRIPEINQKIEVANRYMNALMVPNMDLNDPHELQKFIMGYVFFAVIFEGCWFFNGFSPIFSMQRRGLMKGTGEQLQYIMRDETMHCGFGIRVIREILKEENTTLDLVAISAMFEEARECERIYIEHVLAEPILGYTADDHMGQFEFLCNRRARQLGVPEPFFGAKNVLPWLDAQATIRKEKNFFENRVTEYQGGGLSWDE